MSDGPSDVYARDQLAKRIQDAAAELVRALNQAARMKGRGLGMVPEAIVNNVLASTGYELVSKVKQKNALPVNKRFVHKIRPGGEVFDTLCGRGGFQPDAVYYEPHVTCRSCKKRMQQLKKAVEK